MAKQINGKVLELKDPKGSETSPQVVTQPFMFESRLNKSLGITHARIREIRLDPTVWFLRQAVVAPVIHTTWTIEETQNAPAGAKDLIEKVMLNHRVDLLTHSVLGTHDYGWTPFELVYEVVNGHFEVTWFKHLLHDFTEVAIYEDTGRYAGLLNQPLDSIEEILLIERETQIIYFETEGTDWYGTSVMEVLDSTQTNWDNVNCAADRYDRKVAGSHWVIYYPVGETPYNGTLTANDVIAKNLLNTLEASGAIAIPDEIQEFLQDDIEESSKGKWRVELLSDSSSVQSSFIDRQKYLDILKARAFGWPERSLFEGQFGTKAEAETHVDIGLATVDTKHRQIVNLFNKQAIDYMLELNWGPEAKGSVFIQVAPLSDANLAPIRELYRLIIQNPELVNQEVQNLDLDAMRDMLGIPSTQSKQLV